MNATASLNKSAKHCHYGMCESRWQERDKKDMIHFAVEYRKQTPIDVNMTK